jgi:LysM repeat protein
MVALAHPDSRGRHLRLVTADEVARRRQAELLVMRRRAVVVALVVGLLLALGVLLGRSGGHTVASAGGVAASAGTAPLPVADRAYVVQPGDTLWHIARALQQDGDVRPLVMQLERVRHGAPLRVGERIALP